MRVKSPNRKLMRNGPTPLPINRGIYTNLSIGSLYDDFLILSHLPLSSAFSFFILLLPKFGWSYEVSAQVCG